MRRAVWAPAILIPLIALIVLLALGFRYDPQAAVSPLLNKPAPVFALHSLDGRVVSLQSLRGHPVVVNFWASWCVSCRAEHSTLLRAWKQYTPRGTIFLGVLFKDTAGGARGFLRQYGGGWRVLQDPDDRMAVDYGVTGPPETFVIDRQGIVRLKSTGPITNDAPVTPAHLFATLDTLQRGAA